MPPTATRTKFFSMVDDARKIKGESPPAITDWILRSAFPATTESADAEGCIDYLRTGVLKAVREYLKDSTPDDEQWGFEDIDPAFRDYVEALSHRSYYLPFPDDRFAQVPELIENPDLLDVARKFMRLKATETAKEADALDDLYNAVTR